MRWHTNRWSSNKTFRSMESSGILQCFSGTTVWVAKGGLDIPVPDPFLKIHIILSKNVLHSPPSTTHNFLTWSVISHSSQVSWWSGCHCQRSPSHCLVENDSTSFYSLLFFLRPFQVFSPRSRCELIACYSLDTYMRTKKRNKVYIKTIRSSKAKPQWH